jgi:prophage antirepressor-like protein
VCVCVKKNVYGEHFKYFICLSKVLGQMKDKKVLYFTYLGVLKLLFCAKGSEKAKRFQRWVTKILFTMQMDKDGLAAEVVSTIKKDYELYKKRNKNYIHYNGNIKQIYKRLN